MWIVKWYWNEDTSRERITVAMKHYDKANSDYMNNFDPQKSLSFIIYLGFSNQYGHALRVYTHTLDLHELNIPQCF